MLRRYRAERLLRRDFEGVRERVLASVRANLGARGIVLDLTDLEDCYSQAWLGLYTALMEGQEPENPIGWLTTVCFRRAIDEYRQRSSEQQHVEGAASGLEGYSEPDLAGALDDRLKLRQTFEALRQQLDVREQQAASLCYLQGLSRAQAAEHMGISEARMRKLMEGRGPGRPGVAAKVDVLLKTIQGGGWCEQQASLMRGLAYGVHDPDGERYRLAQLHQRECPACRAYVLSLRGLAAVLPPLALPLVPGMAGLGGALGGGAGSGAGIGGAGSGAGIGGAGSGAGIGGAGSGAGIGGAAGGGAAGSWLPLGGSLGVKLAAGCLLLAGVGGSCVALIASPDRSRHVVHSHDLAHGPDISRSGTSLVLSSSLPIHPAQRRAFARVSTARSPRSAAAVPVASTAQRELGFERAPRRAQARTAPPRGAASEFGPG